MYKDPLEERLCNIEITEGLIVKQLERLRNDKAVGADQLAPRFLNSIKVAFHIPLLFSLRKYCRTRKLWMISIKLMWYQSSRVQIGVYHQTIDQFNRSDEENISTISV